MVNDVFSQNADASWKVLPIRSQQEFETGIFGGEGEQHPHSIARCLKHPEYIYLSHDVGGSWRSTDNGETWNKNLDIGLYLQFGQSIQVDPNNPDIVFIIVDPSYNYKVKNYNGLYRSEDGGTHWDLVLHTDTKIDRLYRSNIAYELSSVDIGNPIQTWYAAFADNGLYRSDDGGKTWGNSPVSSLTGHNIIYEVKTHPTDENIVYVASSLGLYKSNEKGANLKKVNDLPENVTSVCINPKHPDSIFVTVKEEGVYLSEDGGNSFIKILDHPSLRMHINYGFPEQLYLIGNNKNSKYSSDGGRSWNDIPEAKTFPGLGRETGWRRWIDGNMSAVVPNPTIKEEAVAYSRSTIFKTTDGGNSFNESATGWTGNGWSWTDNSAAFSRLDSNTFAFFCNDVGTRITTTGGNWFLENTNSRAWQWYSQGKIKWLGTYSGDFCPIEDSKIMVASIGNYFRTQLMRTDNLGKDWELVTAGESNEEMNLFISFNPDSPNIVYAGSKYSIDTGKTFQKFQFPKLYDSPYVIGMCEAYPDIIYALNNSANVILRSCDAGLTWTKYAEPGWNFRPFDGLPTFAVDPVNPKKIYTLDANHDLASFDGEKWTKFNIMDNIENNGVFNFVRNVAIDPNNPDIIYAGMFASGGPIVFRTLDGGKSWEDISYNISRIGGTLKVNPHTGELYRGTIFGTWIFPAPYEKIPEPDPGLINGIRIYPASDSLEIGDTLSLYFEDITACMVDPVLVWKSDNPSVATVNQKGIVTAIGGGSCTIIGETKDGKYSGECNIFVVHPNSVSDNFMSFTYKVYPNPTYLFINIKTELPRLSKYVLFNIYGQKVLSGIINQKNFRIDLSKLSSGVYVLRIDNKSYKIIKN